MTSTTTAHVRAWARSQGLAVADHGRLPAHVLAAYATAHPEEAPAAPEEPEQRSPDEAPPRAAARRLPLAGLVGVALLLVLSGAAAVLVTAERAPGRAGEGAGVRTAGDVDLEDLEAGDCLSRLPQGAVRSLRAVPCTDPHRAEVYAVFDLAAAGGEYPGDEEVRRRTDGGCDARATALGLPAAGLAAFSFSPDADTWALGDREVVCVLQSEAPLTAPLPRGVRPPPAPVSPAPTPTPAA